MPRLINADKIKLPQGFFEKVDNVPKFYEWLNKLPTVDAVEVVRCKDCEWKEVCKLNFEYKGADGYCSKGKRLEEGAPFSELYDPHWESALYYGEQIDNASTVDAVHVVRCKDCKWYNESKYSELQPSRFCYRLRNNDGGYVGYNWDENDFCSYGERREDE